MNDRYRELAREAGLLVYNPDKMPTKLSVFAELLIRECAKVCRDQPNVYAMKADRDNCAIAIEEHFGVQP